MYLKLLLCTYVWSYTNRLNFKDGNLTRWVSGGKIYFVNMSINIMILKYYGDIIVIEQYI